MKKQGFTHESTYNESKEWYTPRIIFDALKLEFDLDPCSPGADVVPWIPAKKHLTVFEDGLSTDWEGLAFVNPPYGMDTPAWMRKLAKHGHGVGLVFSRTDTGWFHESAVFADCICFIKGRICFVPAEQADSYSRGIRPKGAGCGAGSMLLAFGEVAKLAVMNCGLGAIFLPCAVSRQAEMNVSECGSGVIETKASHCPPSAANENAPGYAEPVQGRLF
jgi:hypothetical protein